MWLGLTLNLILGLNVEFNENIAGTLFQHHVTFSFIWSILLHSWKSSSFLHSKFCSRFSLSICAQLLLISFEAQSNRKRVNLNRWFNAIDSTQKSYFFSFKFRWTNYWYRFVQILKKTYVPSGNKESVLRYWIFFTLIWPLLRIYLSNR